MDKIRKFGNFVVRHQEFILGYVAGAIVVPIVTKKVMSARLPIKASVDVEVQPLSEVAA